MLTLLTFANLHLTFVSSSSHNNITKTSPQAVCPQNQSVVEDKDRGVLISGSSLVLQRVTRDQAGAYSCAASNLEGDAVSNTVNIQIRCESSRGPQL